jgi:hypothetical protein
MLATLEHHQPVGYLSPNKSRTGVFEDPLS